MASKFELKTSKSGQVFFNLKAANGQVILTSETYSSKQAAMGGIASVRTNAPSDERYDRKTTSSGSPYFTLTAANKQILGKSEMYSSVAAMENGIASVKANAPKAEVDDQTAAEKK